MENLDTWDFSEEEIRQYLDMACNIYAMKGRGAIDVARIESVNAAIPWPTFRVSHNSPTECEVVSRLGTLVRERECACRLASRKRRGLK